MSQSEIFLGIDTSAYTTSIAAVSQGKILLDKRKMLKVPQGGRGLRQSEAVFSHVRNLRELFASTEVKNLSAVASSEKPCPFEGSYMPVFCVGASHAAAAAAVAGVPLYSLTHQHGHIYSSFFDNNIPDGKYGAFHVSGGTLDILSITMKNGIVTDIQTLGGSLDITCGQLIDRTGVAAGLKFPSGSEMEKLYISGAKKLAVHVEGLAANLSGAETQALKRLAAGEPPSVVCSAVIDCVSDTLTKLIKNAANLSGLESFLFTGGVICNTIIRENIKNVCAENGLGCVFAQKHLCSDNACGLALAAERLHGKGEAI
jgi:N6-L-threonylcarbamoyladenine synthase